MGRRALRWLFVLGIVLLGVPPPGLTNAQSQQVDLALVLAVDCSFSVDAGEFALQMKGLGAAFQKDDVKNAIRNGHTGRIAVSVMEWSDEANQQIVVPWTVIASDGD